MSELQLFGDAICTQELDGHAVASGPGCDGIAAVSDGDAAEWCGQRPIPTTEKRQCRHKKNARGIIWWLLSV